MYFSGAYGNNFYGNDYICIYKSDGTEAGTVFVVATRMYRPYYMPNLWPQNFVKSGNYLLCSWGSNNISNLTLWMLDLNTNTLTTSGKYPGHTVPYHGTVLLAADNYPTVELWKFDNGNFSSIVKADDYSYPIVLKVFNDKVFLISQNDGSTLNVVNGETVTQQIKNTALGGTPMTTMQGDVYFTGMIAPPVRKIIFKYGEPSSEILASDSQDVTVFPNPVGDTLDLQFGEIEFTTTIIDATGRISKQVENEMNIDVSDLSPGVYILICSGRQRHSTRFLKK